MFVKKNNQAKKVVEKKINKIRRYQHLYTCAIVKNYAFGRFTPRIVKTLQKT